LIKTLGDILNAVNSDIDMDENEQLDFNEKN